MSQAPALASWFPQTPFWTLVAHFVKRLISNQDESSAGLSMSLSAVLALLASPGAFATLFLLDKYSTLLQWLRGQRIDPYRSSAADEYFFIVLSMTITGLIMVLRWNHLFPDRRDFANLAVLPIPIWNVFAANFLALSGLGLLIGFVVNGVSFLLFPAIVTLGDGGIRAYLRVGVAHWIAVSAASLFSFFAVFALIGILMLFLPPRALRKLSLYVRISLVVLLLTEFFSNLFLQLLIGHVPKQPGAMLRWLPSFWFLGTYESLVQIANPVMSHLGRNALFAVLWTAIFSLGAYLLCYRRHFLRLAESPEITHSVESRWTLLPGSWKSILFRTSFERGLSAFVCKAALRSEQHLLFLGAYLGLALVVIAQAAMGGGTRSAPTSLPSSSILSLAFVLIFALISGLRFAFDIPAALQANWVFQVSVERPEPSLETALRNFLVCLVVPFISLVLLSGTAVFYGWRVAIQHALFVSACTVLLIEGVAAKFNRIPFTCAVQTDVRQLVVRVLSSILAVTIGVSLLSQIELWLLRQPLRWVVIALVYWAAWARLTRYKKESAALEQPIVFNEQPSSAFQLLKLT